MAAIFLTVNMGPRPLGAAVGAQWAAQWGTSACLVLALPGFCLQAALIFGSPVRDQQQLPPHA